MSTKINLPVLLITLFILILSIATVVYLLKLQTKLGDYNLEEDVDGSQANEIQSIKTLCIILALLLAIVPSMYFLTTSQPHLKKTITIYSTVNCVIVLFTLLMLSTELNKSKIYLSIVAVCLCAIIEFFILFNLSTDRMNLNQSTQENLYGYRRYENSPTIFVNRLSNTDIQSGDIGTVMKEVNTNVINPIKALKGVNSFVQSNFDSDNLEKLNNILYQDSIASLINISSKNKYTTGSDDNLTLDLLLQKIEGEDDNAQVMISTHNNIKSYSLAINNAFLKYASLLESVQSSTDNQSQNRLKNQIMSTLGKGNNSDSLFELNQLVTYSYNLDRGTEL